MYIYIYQSLNSSNSKESLTVVQGDLLGLIPEFRKIPWGIATLSISTLRKSHYVEDPSRLSIGSTRSQTQLVVNILPHTYIYTIYIYLYIYIIYNIHIHMSLFMAMRSCYCVTFSFNCEVMQLSHLQWLILFPSWALGTLRLRWLQWLCELCSCSPWALSVGSVPWPWGPVSHCITDLPWSGGSRKPLCSLRGRPGACIITVPPRRPLSQEYKWGPSMESSIVFYQKYLSFSLISTTPLCPQRLATSLTHPFSASSICSPTHFHLLPLVKQSYPHSPFPIESIPVTCILYPSAFSWFSNDLIWTFPALHSWIQWGQGGTGRSSALAQI